MKEFVMGYDAREMWLTLKDHNTGDGHPIWWLRFDRKPLSVAQYVWKSLFPSNIMFMGERSSQNETGTVAEGFDICLMPEFQAFPRSYWSYLPALQEFLTENWQQPELPCWLIAISTFGEEQQVDKNVKPVEIDPRWTFLGYDVAEDSTNWGKLSEFGYDELEPFKTQFAPYVNEYLLFDSYEPADAYRKWTDELDPYGHSPNYVYGLYHVDTFPKPKQATL